MTKRRRGAEFCAASSSSHPANYSQTAQAAAHVCVRAAKAQQPIPCPAMQDCRDLSDSLEFDSLVQIHP